MKIDSMQDVAFNMLFAGHDTTASALTLMMRYLKQEPGVLQKIRHEQHQVTPSRPKTNSKKGRNRNKKRSLR